MCLCYKGIRLNFAFIVDFSIVNNLFLRGN